jgi:hypothetical protein
MVKLELKLLLNLPSVITALFMNANFSQRKWVPNNPEMTNISSFKLF